MGLQKTKTSKYGYACDYWRIVQMNMNYDRLDAVITVALYKSEADRNAGKASLQSYSTDIGSVVLPQNYSSGDDTMKNISLKEAYKALKTMAVAEAAKAGTEEEPRDEELAFFADAVTV